MADFASEEWRTALSAYATGLQEQLSRDLSSLSGTGIALDARERLTLTIDAAPRNGASEQLGAQDGEGDAEALYKPFLDDSFLNEWVNGPDLPLIIVAPFGAGKSVLVAEFTRRLAGRLKAWCDEPVGFIPFVPFPVRLRAWPQAQSLIEYMEDGAQKTVDREGEGHLTGQHVRELRRCRRLLPLFDGLDEIPEFGKTGHVTHRGRQESLNSIRRLFPDRHVLTSRPGHGAERADCPGWRGTWHELRDLDVKGAEQLIRLRLKIAAGVEDHPALRAYAAARPNINAVFRRPLFVAAWCNQVARGKRPPESIPQLMEAALWHVLDMRLGDASGGDYAAVRWEVERNQHLLGAVLAAYADCGFDTSKPPSVMQFDRVALDGVDVKKYVQLAETAGLLMRDGDSRYIAQIPVVEYLIGQYYAWLAKTHETAEPGVHQRSLVRRFQRESYWDGHGEIWLHAFEAMWRGTADQQLIASRLLSWIVEMSDRCIATANGGGTLLVEGQEKPDRQSFSCAELVLEMLPRTAVHETAAGAVRALEEKVFAQLVRENTNAWRHGQDSEVGLDSFTRRYPARVCDWLLECLHSVENPAGKKAICKSLWQAGAWLNQAQVRMIVDALPEVADEDMRYYLSRAVGKGAAQLGPAHITMLLDLFNEGRYESRPAILDALSEAARQGPRAANHIVGLFTDTRYRAVWRELAVYFGGAEMELGSDEVNILLSHLANPEYEEEWEWIATAIRWTRHLDTQQVDALIGLLMKQRHHRIRVILAIALGEAKGILPDQVTALVQLLQESQYKRVWGLLAEAVGSARQVDDEHVNAIITLMQDSRYDVARGALVDAISRMSRAEHIPMLVRMMGERQRPGTHYSIARAICKAVGRGPKRVDMLISWLRDHAYKDSWDGVARALSEIGEDIQNAHLDVLLNLLVDVEYEPARRWLASALVAGAARLDAKQVGRLVHLLFDAKYKQLWVGHALAIARGAEHLDCSQANLILSLLSDPEYDVVWPAVCSVLRRVVLRLGMHDQLKQAANAAGRAGRVAFMIRLCDATDDWLIPFVRDVAEGPMGGRIVYGAAARNDPELLLNASFAPPQIQELLGIRAPKAALLEFKARCEGLVLRDKQLDIAFELARSIYLNPKECDVFEVEWKDITDATRRRWRRDVLRLMLRQMDGSQRIVFCQKGEKCGLDALEESAAGDSKNGRSVDASKGKQLVVNAAMLFERLLDKSAVEVMRAAHELLLKRRAGDDSGGDGNPRSYICDGCGAVYPILEGSEQANPPRKDGCRICKRAIISKPRVTPSDVLSCPSDENLHFLRSAATSKGWDFEPRNAAAAFCPCRQCRGRNKLIDRSRTTK